MTVVAILASLIAVTSITINVALVKYLLLPIVDDATSDDPPEDELATQAAQHLLTVLLETHAREKDRLEDTLDDDEVRVALHDGVAYWLVDESIYHAPLDDDGEVVSEEAKPLDILALDNGQVEFLMEILDALKED